MSWKSEIRKAGLHPSKVRDAHHTLALGEVEVQDLKGAVIGDPCRCCGARLIQRKTGAKFVWVGAAIAIVAFSDKRILRFYHNGGIPSMQDKGFFPLGTPMYLKRPPPANALGVAAENNRKAAKRGRKPDPYDIRVPSIHGEFRRK